MNVDPVAVQDCIDFIEHEGGKLSWRIFIRGQLISECRPYTDHDRCRALAVDAMQIARQSAVAVAA
jgi:hypothetical protein